MLLTVDHGTTLTLRLPQWLRGKSTDMSLHTDGTPPPPSSNEKLRLTQSEEVLTPKSKQKVESTPPPPLNNLPPLLQSPQYSDRYDILSDRITMKTIFVPGVPIESVKFNESGQRLAYSTDAGVIQVYQFPVSTNTPSNTKNVSASSPSKSSPSSTKSEKLSPKLLHTVCVSKPNRVVQLCWDFICDDWLFIAIGSAKKHEDYIQIWNVGDKKLESSIAFGNCIWRQRSPSPSPSAPSSFAPSSAPSLQPYGSAECRCPSIQLIACNPVSGGSGTSRLVVSGFRTTSSGPSLHQSVLYLFGSAVHSKGLKWSLTSRSNVMETLITDIEFNHNGKIIIVGGGDGRIRIFDVQNGYFSLLTAWSAHQGAIQSIHLCDDANSILTIATDFIVKYWQLNNDENACKKIWRLRDDDLEKEIGSKPRPHWRKRGSVPLLCLGPNQFFAATESRPRVKEENEETGNHTIQEEKNESVRKKESKGVFNVVIKNINDSTNGDKPSPDEIAVGGHSKMITAIDWHKDSKMLATCSVDGTLRIFEVFRS